MKREEIIADIVQKIMVLSDAKLEGVYDFVNFLSDRGQNKIKQQEEIKQQQVVQQVNHNTELPLNYNSSITKEMTDTHTINFENEIILNNIDSSTVIIHNLPDIEEETVEQLNNENQNSETHSGFDFFQDEKAF